MTEPKLSLHRKLAEVMAEAERIPKNGSYKKPGEYGHFMFVQVGDAADAIRKALAARSVSMLPSAVEVLDQSEHDTKSGGTMTTQTVRTTWTLVDGQSGETAQIQSLGTGADAGDKYSPKAQTNSMKYALLMGFLLSTGDDPELSDSSDRRARRDAVADAAVERTRTVSGPPVFDARAASFDAGLIATAEKGTSDADFEAHVTPDGHRLAFRLTEGRAKVKAVALNLLAELIAEHRPAIEGQRVTAWGTVSDEVQELANGYKRAYQQLNLTRIKVGDLDLSAPEPAEADADFDAGWLDTLPEKLVPA